MRKTLLSIGMLVLAFFAVRATAQTSYTMITSASGLEAGAQYLLVGIDDDGNAYAMSYQKSNNRHAVSVSEAGGVITATVSTEPGSQTEPFEFTLGGGSGAWTLFDAVNNGYLQAPGGGNYLRTQASLTDNGKWDITFDDNGGGIPVSIGGAEQRYMRFNINSGGDPLFGCYKESSNVVAPVYFFKAGGQAQPDPEPSNYPTNFTAHADVLDVVLTWNDATGAQLPDKYLVLASTGSITVPTDGTPVANGDMAANVAYGTQTVTFSGLDGNTTYHFAIFPYTNSGSNIDYKTDGNYPTATATTADMFVLLDEKFDSDLGVFSVYDVYGDQTWQQKSYNNNGYAFMNGYANNVNNANEDWLISPAMNGSYASVVMSFSTAMKFDGDHIKVMVSTDYDGQGEPSDYEWEDITDMFDYSAGEYQWVESGNVDIESYVGAVFHIAFVYTSTATAAAAWEIDNVLIMASQPLSVGEAAGTVAAYPNPAGEQLTVALDRDAKVSVFDMSGRMLTTVDATAGNTTIQVAQLESGVYFLNVRYADGTVAVSKFVKH